MGGCELNKSVLFVWYIPSELNHLYRFIFFLNSISFLLVASTSCCGSACCCWWEDDSCLSCDQYLLIQWYSRAPARTPTTNVIVPVTTTAIPTATFIVTPVWCAHKTTNKGRMHRKCLNVATKHTNLRCDSSVWYHCQDRYQTLQNVLQMSFYGVNLR